ncbi:MAG TPA: ABC transporter substrate-binding protein, partial [Ktedonobacteraceae bacterium]
DACNASSYSDKRAAAQALQAHNLPKASSLFASATSAASSDTTGCNGAEAAIYNEDLQVRQSGHPYGALVVAFDSGPGIADPQGGTDRHILYAAYTQELVGAYIAQQEYNSAAMQAPGAPLLYLVLANTTGVEQGALQIAQDIATLTTSPNMQQFGLLTSGPLSLLGVLGFAPSSLVQLVLPTLCSAGIPLIAPTATGLFIINQLEQTSLYRHCTPGFAFVRFSPDDANQSGLAANYAYGQLHVRRAAIFYDPSNPSSVGSADGFSSNFTRQRGAQIVARETAVASGLLDANGRPQASPQDLLIGLKDALQARPRPDLIFAPLLTNDVITLAQDIAQLPPAQQPILMIGGEFVHPTALQELVQWARQQQLTLPRIYVSLISAARPPDTNEWPKQFYASFCTSFAAPGTHCSGAGILDQGGLLFADGVEIVARALTPATGKNAAPPVITLPSRAALVQLISKERFAGVSSPIRLHEIAGILVTSTQVAPVILGVQDDGSLQIVG